MSNEAPSARTRLKRAPERGAYDRQTIDAILDEGLICHVAFATDSRPAMIPTIYARVGDHVYLHGAVANRTLRALADGLEACFCVSHVDGIVIARSAFHHSINYRSVILYGIAELVSDEAERMLALRALVEHVVPERWPDVRAPNEQEMKRTAVLRMTLDEVSAKVRTGPPIDDEDDYALDTWAGVIPVRTAFGAPIQDPRLTSGIDPPPYVAAYARPPASPTGVD